MLNTLPLEELVKNTENVYEAIIIIAKRARQINQEYKQSLDRENDYGHDVEDYDDDFERKNVEYKRIHQPKATTVALNEFLNGKLKFDYPNSSNE